MFTVSPAEIYLVLENISKELFIDNYVFVCWVAAIVTDSFVVGSNFVCIFRIITSNNK